ncbi:hypothetical protein [Vibrio gangliei]|uniref:hypothetical protein n=1 Tax=Vibrio gangliei TaxID=2077090 RepID=UPI000D01B899|nr:hypothetical protein [Vibrio gangliei]
MSEMSFKHTKHNSAYLLGMFTVLALVAGFFAPQLWEMWRTPSDSHFEASQYCALSRQVCQQSNVSLQLDTDIAKPLQETRLQVQWPDNNSERLLLTLRGLEMDLGTAKFPVIKQPDGSYQGSVVLPICTDSKMTWIGTLSDQAGNKIYASIRMEK